MCNTGTCLFGIYHLSFYRRTSMQNDSMVAFNTAHYLFNYLVVAIGYYKIFGKCGVKKIYSFIPIVREYNIGLCAEKETEGRAYAIISAITLAMSIIMLSMQKSYMPDEAMQPYLILVAASMAMAIANIIYEIRIYHGLIHVFGRSKKWIVMFVLLEGLTSLIWGFSSKFVPERKVENLKGVEGARTSGLELEAGGEGLTVNIKERAVLDLFRKKILLKDIHMTIPRGHMVLLLGGSGAGKTTYLNAVTGYEKANATIHLDGNDVYKDYAKMMYDIGFVPQQDLMRGNDTVTMTLFDAASLRLPSGISFKEKRKRVNQVLEDFGLAAISNSLVEKLSGGQRKRLSIAMEFISDPALFILDEPDSGLDGVVARGLFEKLRAIADQGKIVIVITHTPDRVIDLFDDVIVLAKDAKRTGRLAWYGPVDEAREFFGKNTMEEILLSINQKDEGGEGRADEFVEKYADRLQKEAV